MTAMRRFGLVLYTVLLLVLVTASTAGCRDVPNDTRLPARLPNDPLDPDLPEDDLPPGSDTGTVREGGLYRETSAAEVYIIISGKKIWIPTPDALGAMGYGWDDVTVVSDGTLAAYPRFNIPSSSPTPGSLVYPPQRTAHFPLTGVATTTRMVSQGKEIQLVDLRGWLRGVEPEGKCGDGEDFHYYLEVDTDWAIVQGIDLNRLFRVGNVAVEGIGLSGQFSPRKAVSIPLIKVELDSWGRGEARTQATQKPTDWTFVGNCGLIWPFDHYRPDPNGPALEPMDWDLNKRGPYVRIAGSLITDSPHDVQTRPNVILSRYFAITDSDVAEWQGSAPDWSPGLSTGDPEHYARWTEIHPPDLIQVLAWQAPRTTFRAVALAARVGTLPFGLSNSCESAQFDIYPEASRPANARLAYEELRGPESYFPWGEDENNGSWIDVFDDHIRVRARVCGGAVGGSPGRFKALYRVWWEPSAGDQPYAPRSGNFTTSDQDRIDYLITPSAVSADVVEFQLCLGDGLTWEKQMNLPDGLGNSWDVKVKDSTRCTAEALWADQVANGQSLTFSKAKFLGSMTPVHVLPLSSLGALPGGTRVTFTWIKDN